MDTVQEFFKIYNSNNFSVDLTGWIIKDITGTVKEFVLNGTIPVLGDLAFKRPETGITLNNDGDGLILLNPNLEVVDSVSFEKAVTGELYLKNSSGWTWTQTLSPQKTNKANKAEIQPLSLTAEVRPRQIKLVESLQGSPRVSMAFVGFLIALCSAIVFLIIKNNLKNFWY